MLIVISHGQTDRPKLQMMQFIMYGKEKDLNHHIWEAGTKKFGLKNDWNDKQLSKQLPINLLSMSWNSL